MHPWANCLRVAAISMLVLPRFAWCATATVPATAATAPSDSEEAASLVTLHFKDAPPKTVYESLYEQAHTPLVTEPNLWDRRRENKNVTIDIDQVPYWSAMRKLNKQTHLAPMDFPGMNWLTEDHFGGLRGPASIHGPYMVVADESAGSGRFNRLKVYVEPRLQVLSHVREADVELAKDEDGESVPLSPRDRRRDFDEMAGNVFDVELPLDPGDREARLVHVKGSVRVVLAATRRKLEIPDILNTKDDQHTEDNHRFQFIVVTPEPGEYIVKLNTTDLSTGPGSTPQVDFNLFDAKGNALQKGGMTGGGGGKGWSSTVHFQQGPGNGLPVKLVLEYPSQAHEVTIPFEFEIAPMVGK